jgi:hypothetical protein
VTERLQGARAAHEHPRGARGAQGAEVTCREIDGIHLCQLAPRQPTIGERGLQARSERGDRALAGVVDERHRTAGRPALPGRPHVDAKLAQA